MELELGRALSQTVQRLGQAVVLHFATSARRCRCARRRRRRRVVVAAAAHDHNPGRGRVASQGMVKLRGVRVRVQGRMSGDGGGGRRQCSGSALCRGRR